MTEAQIEAFYLRLEASIRAAGYHTIKEFIQEGHAGLTYESYMSKKSRNTIMTTRTIDRLAMKLGVSTDFLLYGKASNKEAQMAFEELRLITAYREAPKSTKIAIKALLEL